MDVNDDFALSDPSARYAKAAQKPAPVRLVENLREASERWLNREGTVPLQLSQNPTLNAVQLLGQAL